VSGGRGAAAQEKRRFKGLQGGILPNKGVFMPHFSEIVPPG